MLQLVYLIATLRHGFVLVFIDRPILSFILIFCSRISLKQRMLRMIPCRAVVISERIPFVLLRLSKLENDQSKFLVVNTYLMNCAARLTSLLLFFLDNGKVVASNLFKGIVYTKVAATEPHTKFCIIT